MNGSPASAPAVSRLSTGRYVVAACGFMLAVAALALGLAGPTSAGDTVRAITESLTIGVPIAVGLFALVRDSSDRFAKLLVIAGFAWAPTMLIFTDASVPYSIGRVFGWVQEATLVYLMLALPLGRLTTVPERLVASAAAFIVAGLFLPSALFAEFPNPSPWSTCITGCPDNALMVSSSQPDFFTSILSLRGVLTVTTFLAAAAVLGFRIMRDRRVAGVFGPALIVAVAHLFATAAFFILRAASPAATATDVTGAAALITTPLLILAFFAGLLHWRLVARNAWTRLGPDGAGSATSERIRALVADALGDPSLEIGYWDRAEQRWIDDDGWPFALPAIGSGRAYTEISTQGKPVAVLVHEYSHLAEPTIRDLVRGAALMALENQRLEAGMRAATRALRVSRARIMAAIDKDRLRIERDLHDGAQQRLIALKVAADLGADTLRENPDRAVELFRRIGDDAGLALEEVRSLARGVYPPLLIDFGLVAALNDACSRVSVPAVMRARGVGRYPPEIEAAVYFCCLEALQNAEKHADARSVTITLVASGRLSFEVRDNGCGFDMAYEGSGSGFGNMRERIAAVDGRLQVDSMPGVGTRIGGTVPLAPDRLPPEVERLVLNASDALQGAMGIYNAVRNSGGTVVDFAVEHVNDAACRMTGLSRQSQVGRTLGQLDPAYARSNVFKWHCQALEATEALVREECEYAWTAAGRRLQVAYEVRAVAMGAGRIALVWNDITERKRAERELAFRAEAVAREEDGVCVVRAATGAIAFANERFERMLGYEPGDLEGRNSTELDWREVLGPGVDELGEAQTRVVSCRRKDGSELWTELTLNGFDDPDLGWCWVSVHRDVTEQRAERELARLRSERLGEALRHLPVLAYTADPELRCTVLFDNLIDPLRADAPRSGTNAELFGPLIADQIASLNRRAVVTGQSARGDMAFGGRASVTVSVEPVMTADGQLIGLVGSAIARDADGHVPELKPAVASRAHQAHGPRVFSRRH